VPGGRFVEEQVDVADQPITLDFDITQLSPETQP
jgi:hypothetical protein